MTHLGPNNCYQPIYLNYYYVIEIVFIPQGSFVNSTHNSMFTKKEHLTCILLVLLLQKVIPQLSLNKLLTTGEMRVALELKGLFLDFSIIFLSYQ